MTDPARRRRIVRLQRYLINPPVKAAVYLGVVPGHALVETVGRVSGKRRRTVVGVHRDGASYWAVAEQGRYAGYVRNLMANPDVRLRLGRRWVEAVATAVPDDDTQRRLDTFGRPGHAKNVRRFGTDLLSVRFDVR